MGIQRLSDIELAEARDHHNREWLATIMRKHAKELIGLREEMLERLIVLRVSGIKAIKLVEDHSDPGKTVYSFDVDFDGIGPGAD